MLSEQTPGSHADNLPAIVTQGDNQFFASPDAGTRVASAKETGMYRMKNKPQVKSHIQFASHRLNALSFSPTSADAPTLLQ